jgi:hypothetical protein
VKSLFDARHGLHTGMARCIDKYSGLAGMSIKRQQTNLPPQKHNNKLFAELIALNVNIKASDAGITPFGFSNLIYDDGTTFHNPMNGLTIRQIAARCDSFMSSFRDTIGQKFCHQLDDFGIDPETLYAKIHAIDSVFYGPIDTVIWSGDPTRLQFTGVRELAGISFLRYDASKIQPVVFGQRSFIEVPEEFRLYQNYPNPFNPTTTLSYYLTNRSFVTLKVYNLLGQEVATLIDRQLMEEGDQETLFDASRLSSGVYFYQIKVEVIGDEENGIAQQTLSAVKKMVLIK